MAPETDLARMLAGLQVRVREGEYVFVTLADADETLASRAQASVQEEEGIAYVLSRADADAHGLPYDFRAAWLTLGVHSALHAVGLTAAVSTALAARGIPCNVLAGFHHDHLLVPSERRDEALAALAELQQHDAA